MSLQDGGQKLVGKGGPQHLPPLLTHVVKMYITIIYGIYIPMSVQLMENEVLQ